MRKYFSLIFLFLSQFCFAAEFNLKDTTIDSIQAAIKDNQFSCEQIIEAYLNRIKQYNLSVVDKPPINAFTALNTQALMEAKELDDYYNVNKKFFGPLHCVPVVIKDNIDTTDMTSTSGSLALLGNQPQRDAFLVKKIKEAGGIIIGKGTMDELAAGMVGLSTRSGRTGNAYDQDYNPGGSSGGVAAAVSMNFAVLGIGSDNSGSIRIPAAFNGISGLRPSMGLISQQGIFPRGNMDGVAGPMARDVHDLAVLLDVIAKPDPNDKKTQAALRPQTYTSFLKENALQGKRIGIVRLVNKKSVYNNQTNELIRLLRDMQVVLQQQGAVTIPNISLPKFDTSRKNNEAGEKEDIDEYLSSFPSVRKNYEDLCKSNRSRALGKNTQACLDFIKEFPARDSQGYKAAEEMFKRNQQYVEKIMDEHHLDALLIPMTKSGTATYNTEELNPITVSSNSGLPSIVINIGYSKDNGLPVGVELTGKKFSEGELIGLAYSFEQHTPPRVIPRTPAENPDTKNMSLVELNHIFDSLGFVAFEKVLKDNKSVDLTADKFQQITRDVIKAAKEQ